MNDTPSSQAGQHIECRASHEPAVRRFIVAAGLIGFGLWCWSDRAKYTAPQVWDLPHINEAASYLLNHWGPFLLVPAGMIALAFGIRQLMLHVTADEEGLAYRGRHLAWKDVKVLDARQLVTKGLLVLEPSEGKPWVLDSYRIRDFRQLVAFIEAHTPAAEHRQPPTPAA
jgi:hypothetical protein